MSEAGTPGKPEAPEVVEATEATEVAEPAGEEKEKKGGLTKLTAQIVAVATLLGGVVTAVNHLDTIVSWLGSEKPTTADGGVKPPAGTHAHECIEIEPLYQPVVPLALQYNFASSDDFYWLKLNARNSCAESFSLKVFCDPIESTHALTCSDYPAFQVPPGQSVSRQIDPRLEFLRPVDEEVTLLLKILVQDQQQDGDIFNDTLQISVLPTNTYFWDLDDTAKSAVIASLVTWTVRPRAPVHELSDQLAADFTTVEDWMEKTWSTLAERITVLPDNREIPPRLNRYRLRVESPETVLESGRANPIESALLFGALGYRVIKDYGARIIFISAPAQDASAPNEIYVAWEQLGTVRAFNSRMAGELGFEQSVEEGTLALGNLLQDIRVSLYVQDSNGVFMHPDLPRVVALDLGQVMESHNIHSGLP